MVTLDDVMQKLELTDVVLQQLRRSSNVVDSRLSLIQDSMAGMERTLAGIRSNVADLPASHELLTKRVTALEAKADAADSDSTRVRDEVAALRSQLSELASHLSSIKASRVSSDINISGIPASITDFSRIMVLKLFEALGILELAVDVLDVRCLTKKDSSAISDRQRPSAANGTSLSFIITLESLSIRNHIISRKRQIKSLTINNVFAVDRPGKMYVHEFLPAADYGLFRRTKVVAGQQAYKYTWVRSGEVCVRKSDGSDIVVIRSKLDLGSSSDWSLFIVFRFFTPTLVGLFHVQSSLVCLFRILLSLSYMSRVF